MTPEDSRDSGSRGPETRSGPVDAVGRGPGQRLKADLDVRRNGARQHEDSCRRPTQDPSRGGGCHPTGRGRGSRAHASRSGGRGQQGHASQRLPETAGWMANACSRGTFKGPLLALGLAPDGSLAARCKAPRNQAGDVYPRDAIPCSRDRPAAKPTRWFRRCLRP